MNPWRTLKMAPRKTVLRLALVAGLAVLLSGCYAHGGGRYSSHYGSGYAYGGGGHYATPGHADPRHGHRGPGRHAQRRHGYRHRGW